MILVVLGDYYKDSYESFYNSFPVHSNSNDAEGSACYFARAHYEIWFQNGNHFNDDWKLRGKPGCAKREMA
jgi:hypothetical protein